MQPIEIVQSTYLVEELRTDGHSPMKFLCNNDHLYYCKYLPTSKRNEIDFLAYEIICHYLLRFLNIPTPDIALVQIVEGTYDKKSLIKNKTRLKPGVICFGGKSGQIDHLKPGEVDHPKNRLFQPDFRSKLTTPKPG